jgi:hypothetical protein
MKKDRFVEDEEPVMEMDPSSMQLTQEELKNIQVQYGLSAPLQPTPQSGPLPRSTPTEFHGAEPSTTSTSNMDSKLTFGSKKVTKTNGGTVSKDQEPKRFASNNPSKKPKKPKNHLLSFESG